MRGTTAFTLPFLLAAGIALARPQVDTSELSGLPACVQDAATAALGSSGCPLNDKDCICRSTAFINAITTTVTQQCSASDVSAALNFAQTFCGASLGASGSTGSSSSSPTVDPAAGSDSGSSGAVSTTTVPGGTVTSMTTIASAIPPASSSAPASVSVSSMPATGNATTSRMGPGVIVTTSCTTITMTATPSGTYTATYTGAASAVRGSVVGQGIMAAAVGVAGAVALL